jgi:hypothetical protein
MRSGAVGGWSRRLWAAAYGFGAIAAASGPQALADEPAARVQAKHDSTGSRIPGGGTLPA